MINYQDSTLTIESWKDHKITLRCAVKKAFQDSEVRFFWEQKDNRLDSSGRQVDKKTMSEMTFISVTDAEFNPVTCIAKTKTTTQRLEIKIKRLCEYVILFCDHIETFLSASTMIFLTLIS